MPLFIADDQVTLLMKFVSVVNAVHTLLHKGLDNVVTEFESGESEGPLPGPRKKILLVKFRKELKISSTKQKNTEFVKYNMCSFRILEFLQL